MNNVDTRVQGLLCNHNQIYDWSEIVSTHPDVFYLERSLAGQISVSWQRNVNVRGVENHDFYLQIFYF